MPAQLIDGRALADAIKDSVVQEVLALPTRPNLAIVLVGNRADSALYVRLKEREGKKVGVDTHLYRFDEDVPEEQLLGCIDFLNHDDLIDGILLQLPLPGHLDENKIVAAVAADKDIDGFHPENLRKIRSVQLAETHPTRSIEHPPLIRGGSGRGPVGEGRGEGGVRAYLIPPLASVIIAMVESTNETLSGKTVALVARSDVFTSGIGDILTQRGARVTHCHPDDANLMATTSAADVVVTAVGHKHYLTTDYIKDGAIIIDVGIVREKGETFGDVDFNSVKDKAAFVSPVPGGVGPMTIAFAFKNVVELYKRKRG